MVKHGIHDKGVDVPPLKQPGTHFCMRGADLTLLCKEPVDFQMGHVKEGPIGLGKINAEDQSSQIVDQTGKKDLLWFRLPCPMSDYPGQDGGEEGMMPETE